MEQHYDIAIVGGGIVGASLAFELLNRRPQLRLALLEKESVVGEHQTGHKSGVLHSGIYYRSGSLKAQLCVEGARRMAELCASRNLPFLRCGKLIVAVEEAELPVLADLHQRGLANGVEGVQLLDELITFNDNPLIGKIGGLRAGAVDAPESVRTASL